MSLVRPILTSLGVFRKQCRHLLRSLAGINTGQQTECAGQRCYRIGRFTHCWITSGMHTEALREPVGE
jgi:hypothetical protein